MRPRADAGAREPTPVGVFADDEVRDIVNGSGDLDEAARADNVVHAERLLANLEAAIHRHARPGMNEPQRLARANVRRMAATPSCRAKLTEAHDAKVRGADVASNAAE